MNEARRLAAIVVPAALVVLGAALACEPQKAGNPDAGPVASEPSAPSALASAVPAATAESPSAHAAHWEEARNAALRIPCRAIAVDGSVRTEGADAGALALQGEIPDETWLSLEPDARLVAKDPRTTRETAFVGPARVRPCVAHREESWLAAGRFESAIGAGETPGAEEWVVTPLGVVRYMAGKIAVEVRAKDAVVAVGSGVGFLWLADGVRAAALGAGASAGAGAGADSGADSGAGPALDDDGWLRMSEGEVTLSGPTVAARTTVDRCAALAKRSGELAATLLAGADGSTAKEQMRTRRLARAACAVASLHVDTLPPSALRGEMSARLESATAAFAPPPAASAPP
ncbi:MAG TPA: hypothetical protein VK762_08250 [Polyangiaceae bacterium]|nr:hypothetical protein [Polyangiaceae bacterium]